MWASTCTIAPDKLPLQLFLQIHFGVRWLRLCLIAMRKKMWRKEEIVNFDYVQFGNFDASADPFNLAPNGSSKRQRIITYYYHYYWQSVKTWLSAQLCVPIDIPVSLLFCWSVCESQLLSRTCWFISLEILIKINDTRAREGRQKIYSEMAFWNNGKRLVVIWTHLPSFHYSSRA